LQSSTHTFFRYNIVVINIVADNALENRATLYVLATESVTTVFSDYFSDNGLELLPDDLKFAFWHPVNSDVLIFISADMPYLVQKLLLLLRVVV